LKKVYQMVYATPHSQEIHQLQGLSSVAWQNRHKKLFYVRVNYLLRIIPYDLKRKIIIKTGSTMPEWGDDLAERIQRFTEVTGLTEEQLIKATDNQPPHNELFVDTASEKGLTPEKYREEQLQENIASLVTEESIQAIKRLQDEVGFSADDIAVVIDTSYDEGAEIIETMAQDKNIRDFQLLTKVAGVPTDEIIDLYKDKNPEDRYGITEYGPLDDMIDEHFPDKDWGKHEDVDTSGLAYEDPIIKEIMGEPKGPGFTEQLVERDIEDGKDEDKHR
jgi:hypothetical protein